MRFRAPSALPSNLTSGAGDVAQRRLRPRLFPQPRMVLNEGATLGFEELTAYLAEEKVAKFMWPEQLDIVMEMPMTPTRKVIKPKLVRLLLAQTGMQGRPAA
jgi:hypothetical protein